MENRNGKVEDVYWFWKVINSFNITKGFLFGQWFNPFGCYSPRETNMPHQKANDENYCDEITNIQNRCQIIRWKRCLQICCLLCYILSVGWERLIHGFVLLFIIGSKSLTIKILFRYLKYCCHSGPAHKWIVECWPLSSCFPPPILNLCLIWNTVLWKMYTWWHLGWLFLGTADRGNPMVRTTNS